MKSLIGRMFRRRERPAQPSVVSSEMTSSDIENYYLRIIVDGLKRMLVPSDAVEVGVKRSGTGPSGLAAYAGYVRLLRWDPVLTPVLLQNMPVIDARIRRVVHASVILEHTHFSGLWFQATDATPGAPKNLVGMPAELQWQSGGPTSTPPP
ncbi:MAG: hypothetical protein HY854_18975 [Burkholderiales bacterium]|nr:hypothetical protein [Burkholderiales bacterium]